MRMFSQSELADNYRKSPSALWNVQAHAIRHILDEIIDSEENLRKYYCEVRPRKYDETFVPSVLLDTPPIRILEDEDQHSRRFDFQGRIWNPAESDTVKPILILSSVGRGKTTFLHHTAKIQFPEILQIDSIKFMIIDARVGFASDVTLFHRTLNEKIGEQLEMEKGYYFLNVEKVGRKKYFKQLAAVFRKELLENNLPEALTPEYYERQIKVILQHKGDIENFNARRIHYLKTKKGHRVIIVVDNLDQLLKYYQERAFLDSLAVASKLKCPIIITLRDSSFGQQASNNALSAYHPEYLNLSLPSIPDLVKRRLEGLRAVWEAERSEPEEKFTLNYEGEQHEISKHGTLDGGIKVLDFLTGKEHGDALVNILIQLSNFNLRELLRLLKMIFSSYHSFAPAEARFAHIASDEIEIRLPKIYLALILGNNPYYKDDASDTRILNLFHDMTNGHANCFLRLRILQYLSEKQFGVKVGQLVTFFNDTFRADPEMIGEAVNTLVKKTLITAPSLMNELLEQFDYVKHSKDKLFITFCGQFHIKELIYNDRYLDEIKFSSMLPEEEFQKVFFRNFHVRVENRTESTIFFLNYLRELEKTEGQGAIMKDAYDKFPKVTEAIYSRYVTRSRRPSGASQTE